MKKKINPRRIPATMADVEKAKKDVQDRTIRMTWAIFFSVLRDKHGFGKQRLKRVWDEVNELSDSIIKGYVNVNDLARALEAEANIVLGE